LLGCGFSSLGRGEAHLAAPQLAAETTCETTLDVAEQRGIRWDLPFCVGGE